MKIIIHLSIICLIFSSCSKSDPTPPTPPPPPPIPDTLTTGWTKAGAGIPATAYIYDVFFTNSTTGFASSDKGIFKSTDGGINWSIFSTVNNTVNIGGLGSRYCFVGNDNKIHYTNNGTDFFSNTYLLAGNTLTLGFRDCFIASPAVVYACSGRYIYKSLNSGVSFDSIYVFPAGSGESHSIFFTSVTDGWLVRTNGLFKTTDGGVNWSFVNLIGSFNSGAIDFLSPTTGLVSEGMNIHKTTNGGATWSLLFSQSSFAFIDVEILSANDIYMSSENKIYKSVNGGASFTQVLSSGENGIIEIHFIDVNTGWACGTNGAIYRYKQ